MAHAIDTLGYAQRLRAAGVKSDQAEAHAEAVRDFIVSDLVTKGDLRDAMERQTLRLTIWLGGVMVAGMSALGVFIRLTQ